MFDALCRGHFVGCSGLQSLWQLPVTEWKNSVPAAAVCVRCQANTCHKVCSLAQSMALLTSNFDSAAVAVTSQLLFAALQKSKATVYLPGKGFHSTHTTLLLSQLHCFKPYTLSITHCCGAQPTLEPGTCNTKNLSVPLCPISPSCSASRPHRRHLPTGPQRHHVRATTWPAQQR